MKKTIIATREELNAFSILIIENNRLYDLIQEALDNSDYRDREFVIKIETND